MIYKTFFLTLGEDVEPSLQDPNKKGWRSVFKHNKNTMGGNFTEATRRDSEVFLRGREVWLRNSVTMYQ